MSSVEEHSLVYESARHPAVPSNGSPEPVTNNNDVTSLTTCMSVQSPPRRTDADTEIIAKVEKVFEAVIDSLLHNSDELSISIKIKKSPPASVFPAENATEPIVEIRKVTFPGRTAHEAWRFSTIVITGTLDLTK